MPRRLDRKRPYGTVNRGNDFSIFHTYEQDGYLFDHEGREMNPKTGALVSGDVSHGTASRGGKGGGVPAKQVAPESPKADKDSTSAPAPSTEPEKTDDPDPGRLITIEVDGDPMVIDPNSNHYTSRGEIKEAIDKLGGSYYARDSRNVLFEKLLRAARRWEENQSGA